MPLYSYHCASCLTTIDSYHSTPDGGPDSILCPVCKDKRAKKVLSTFAIRMDGKLRTEGGPIWDGKSRDLGILDGDAQEASEKEQRDYRQAQAKGKGMKYIEGEK